MNIINMGFGLARFRIKGVRISEGPLYRTVNVWVSFIFLFEITFIGGFHHKLLVQSVLFSRTPLKALVRLLYMHPVSVALRLLARGAIQVHA